MVQLGAKQLGFSRRGSGSARQTSTTGAHPGCPRHRWALCEPGLAGENDDPQGSPYGYDCPAAATVLEPVPSPKCRYGERHRNCAVGGGQQLRGSTNRTVEAQAINGAAASGQASNGPLA